MPVSTKDSNGPSPAHTPAATNSGPNSGPSTPMLGRNSRTSTRRSTPVGTPGATATKHQLHPLGPDGEYSNTNDMAEWIAPPPSKPSFKEYDPKATPNASTYYMQPLGELPSAKTLEATKRPFAYQSKKKGKSKNAANRHGSTPGAVGGARPGQAGKAKTTTPTATANTSATTTPTTTKVTTAATTTATTTAASSEASGRASGSPSAQAPSTARPGPPNPWYNGNAPSSKTAQGRQRLSMVVEAAVHRSQITGHLDMGRAIKKLYEESLTDNSLADLLDSVLAQRSTPQQFKQFQNYVRTARANAETFWPYTAQAEREAARGGRERERIEVQAEVKKEPEQENTSQDMRGSAQNDERSTDANQWTSGGIKGDSANSEASSSDMHSPRISEEPSGMAISIAGQSNASTPQPTAEFEHPSRRVKIPSYEELKTDSHVRGPPPKPAVRTRGKKRARSPSLTRSVESPEPAPAALVAPPAPASASASVSISTPAPAVAENTPPAAMSTIQTPVQPPHPHPKKKSKSNKPKTLPVKKAVILDNTVVTAGIGEVSDHRRARGGSEEVSENEDVCAVCNGSGRFLCCERCPRSFHFSCLDPPLEDVPEGMWFCNKCQAQTDPPPKEPKGLFSNLLDNLKRRNPSSFMLPPSIRHYFAGVQTGPLGEYVDSREAKTLKYDKAGFVTDYDTKKLKDKQGGAILCHDCGKSSVNGQQIISCDYCPLHWHMDCIRPMPMSNPPSVKRKWMCPAHADSVLARRRPKNAPVVDTVLRRGHKNDGLIEIENEESDDDQPAFEEITMCGVIYRLPERGIKLDFLDKVKEVNEAENALRKRSFEGSLSEQPAKKMRLLDKNQTSEELASITEDDMALASTLVELSQKPINAPNTVGCLVMSLLHDASPQLVTLLSQPNEAAPLDHERQQLIALRELISARLVKLVEQQPAKENGYLEIVASHDKKFDSLLNDTVMEDDYQTDEPPRGSSQAPVAPMAPMMTMAPVAPMAPMAFMKPA